MAVPPPPQKKNFFWGFSFGIHECLSWNYDNFYSDDINKPTVVQKRDPISIKQLNSNIQENLNKIEQFQNETRANNKILERKLIQVKDEEIFLVDVEEEKILFKEKKYNLLE